MIYGHWRLNSCSYFNIVVFFCMAFFVLLLCYCGSNGSKKCAKGDGEEDEVNLVDLPCMDSFMLFYECGAVGQPLTGLMAYFIYTKLHKSRLVHFVSYLLVIPFPMYAFES